MDEIVAANLRRYESDVVDTYTTERYHRLRYQCARRLLLDALADVGMNRPLLELAPGTVPLCNAGILAGSGLVAVDLSDQAVRIAGERCGHRGVIADLSRNLPFRDGAFCAAVAMDVIEHLFNTPRFLGEINRVVAMGGSLVLTTPNLATIQDRVRFIFGLSPRQVNAMHPYLNLHIRPFTLESLIAIVTANGFHVTSTRTNAVVWRSRRGTHILSALPRRLAGLGGSLAVRAIKVRECT